MTDIAQIVDGVMPYVTTALRAYGSGVLDKIQDTATDAAVDASSNLGRRILRRLLKREPSRPIFEAALLDASSAPADADSIAALRHQIRKAFAEDETLRADVLEIFDQAGPRIVATGEHSIAAHEISGIGGHTISGIYLGGMGGAAPGAGGGGGGAIGDGATGGPGGSVGRIELDGRSGQDFGAGGGGGGAFIEGSIPFTSHELQTGVAGSGDVYGTDSQPGGSSSFGDLLVLPGGSPALAGSGIRLTSDRIRISTLTPADCVQIRDRVAGVMGGSWTWINIGNLPQTHNFTFLIVFEAGEAPAGDYTARIAIHDPEGKEARALSFPITVDVPGNVVRIPIGATLEVQVTDYGVWTAVVSTESGKLAECPIVVRRSSA